MVSPTQQVFGNPLRHRIEAAKIWWIGALCLAPVLYLFLHDDYEVLITALIIGAILLLMARSTQLAILCLFGYLVLLGDIRRVVTVFVGARTFDPLLLVGALLTLYLAVPLLLEVRLNDTLSKIVFATMAVMAVEIFNPRQGPLAVGLSGALYLLVPLLWFWIGRRYGTDKFVFALLFRLILPLGVLAAVLGICQTYIGFFPWEEAWGKGQGHAYLLSYGGHLRSFGFSSSGAEYGVLLLITSTLIAAAIVAKRRAYTLLLPVVLLAMVLSAMRGPLVAFVLAVAMMWALKGKQVIAWIPRLVFSLVLGAGLLVWSARQSGGDSDAGLSEHSSTAYIASARVSQGLAHPFEQKYSTGGLHNQLFWSGILSGFINPIGVGLGATSIGSGKFGGDLAITSTEIDISDAFVTTGLCGGLLYVWIVVLLVLRSPAFLRNGSLITRLATIGLLTALLGKWSALGQYGTAPLAWFCIGAVARSPASLAVLRQAAQHAPGKGTMGPLYPKFHKE